MNTIWKSRGLVIGAFAVTLIPAVLHAADWYIDTVDAVGAGRYTSMKIDKSGNVHVAYIPETDRHPLKYAYWDHSIKKWFTMNVAEIASFCTLTLDSQQRPHISYADHGTGLGAKLRYASWDGLAWRVEAIPVEAKAVVAYYTSIALDAHDKPVFSFYDYADSTNTFRLRLRSVFWKDSVWEVRTVDPMSGSGKFNVIAIDSHGTPHIAYANVKAETSSLRYATWNGQSWNAEIIEGAAGPFPVYSVGMVLDKDDNPHIAYTDMEHRLVKYATRRQGKWVTSAVDSVRIPAYPDRDGIALDSSGNPYVSYYDQGTGMLKVATLKNGTWMAAVLDRNYAGFTSSMAIDRDTLWVSYSDETGAALKVAHHSLESSPTVEPPRAAETAVPAKAHK